MPRWTVDPRMCDDPTSICQHSYRFSAPWNFTREAQRYSWPGCSASGEGKRSTVIVIPPGVFLREDKAHRSLPPSGQTRPNSSFKVPDTSTCLWPQPSLTSSVAAFPLCPSVNGWSFRMSFNVSFFVLESLPPLESVFARTCLVVRW